MSKKANHYNANVTVSCQNRFFPDILWVIDRLTGGDENEYVTSPWSRFGRLTEHLYSEKPDVKI